MIISANPSFFLLIEALEFKSLVLGLAHPNYSFHFGRAACWRFPHQPN